MSDTEPNVTLPIPPKAEEKDHIGCFLCNSSLEIRQDKNGKPYFICDICGIQTFIRKQSGIREFKRFISENAEISRKSLKIAQLAGLREQLANQLNSIRDGQGLISLFKPNESDPAILALENQISEIELTMSKFKTNE